MNGSYESCPPEAGALINSLRAFGYDLSMAIADLIDNSIYAGAQNICIDYSWNAGDPWIRIVDDGQGMAEGRLRESMRLGSQSPLDERQAADLGRFGLGLKTASFSQCTVLTVASKTLSDPLAVRAWDLEHVRRTGEWQLSKDAPSDAEGLLSVLESQGSGTVVLWQKLDRVVSDATDELEDGEQHFLACFDRVADYLEMVFHRYIAGPGKIRISVGRHQCKPWDPFLKSNPLTQELPTERHAYGQVVVTPYVLPHVSKRSKSENETGSGIYGWNAHQGFYVYRNKRMIIPGGYLDFNLKQEEHFKLCRIRVDLPNSLDHEWGIDVRKAAASPPSHVRGDLERIAKATRARAVSVYRARSGARAESAGPAARHSVWIRESRRGKLLYRINRENEAIRRILDEAGVKQPWVRKLFHLIENSVPHRLIIIDNAENEDCHVDLPEDFAPPPNDLLALCKLIFLERVDKGVEPNHAADYACAFFDDHPSYRATLDALIEEME